jgi:cytochrome c-type biogenesis protein
MYVIELGFAFLAGLAMIASPCVLMLLPILLGTSLEQRSRPVFIILGFVTAFGSVAVLFAQGVHIAGSSPGFLRQCAIVLLALFALPMLFPTLYARMGVMLQGVADLGLTLSPNPGAGKIGGLMLGLSLGAVWTPCSGPILASIITLIAGATNMGRGLGLLVAFGLGTGLPMLLVAYGGKAISSRLAFIARHGDAMRRAFGAVMLIVVAYMQWQQYDELAGWLANGYQGWLATK